jgi:hypothetical protein
VIFAPWAGGVTFVGAAVDIDDSPDDSSAAADTRRRAGNASTEVPAVV